MERLHVGSESSLDNVLTPRLKGLNAGTWTRVYCFARDFLAHNPAKRNKKLFNVVHIELTSRPTQNQEGLNLVHETTKFLASTSSIRARWSSLRRVIQPRPIMRHAQESPVSPQNKFLLKSETNDNRNNDWNQSFATTLVQNQSPRPLEHWEKSRQGFRKGRISPVTSVTTE